MRNGVVAVVAGALLLATSALAADQLSYSGSSTIGQSILEAAGAKKAFEAKAGVKFGTFEVPGSGKGIDALLADKVTVAGVSRVLKAEEKAKGLIATTIGYDAVAIFVNAKNPLTNLTKEQLKGIFTGQITNWKAVGGADAPIHVNTEIQGAKRATIEVFQELALDKAPFGKGFKEIDLPKDQIVEVAKDELGIGTPSFGLLAAIPADLRSKVKALNIDGIAPTDDNIQSGAYLISRPLLLVTKGLPKGDTKTFVEYMLSPEGQRAVEVSFVPVRKK